MRRLVLSIAWAVALVLLLTHSPWADDQPGNGGITPPWIDEKVKPPEIKDLDDKKEYPIFICTKTTKEGLTEHIAYYSDFSEVRYVPGIRWTIRVHELLSTKKIFYDLVNRTRTVERPGEPPKETPWKDAPMPPTGKTTPSREPIIRDLPLSPRSTPIVPAKPTPKPTPTTVGSPEKVARPAPTTTQETPPTVTITFIVKAGATVGGPGDDSTVHFDDPPPITPEEFVAQDQGKTAPVDYPRKGTDREGPTFNPLVPPPDGEPPGKTYSFAHTSITTLFGWNMFINVGWGWAHATVPSDMVFACADMDEYQEHLKEAQRLRDLAKKAEIGGPGYWLRQAQAARSDAARIASKLASRSDPRGTIANALRIAEGHEKLAKELKDRGVPDEPDATTPKAEWPAIKKARAAAIKKIDDEAIDHLHQARDAL